MTTFICPHCGQSHRQDARFCNVTGKSIQVLVDVVPPVDTTVGMTGKLPPNQILRGRFLILHKIGQGGMAAVYQAADTSQPGTLWAIKEMSDKAIPNPEERDFAVQAFLQEAKLLRALNHPNLPQVTDVFTEGGKYYLVMEFVQGKTIQELIASRVKPFTEAEVLPWAMQLCDVLTYLHNQSPKIIFRDLKPSNIMVTEQGTVKLIDFGIVRFFKPGKSKDTMALGTPGYASPEAIGGQTDERSDVYSLCVTLHHLLTLHDPVTTMFNLPPAKRINSSISPDMEHIVMRGVQNQREKRWQNVLDMQKELAKLAGKRTDYPGSLPRVGKATSAPGMIAAVYSSEPVVATTAVGNGVFAPMPVEATRLSPAFGTVPSPIAQTAAPMRTSRPTTRLVMTAARLSGKQFTLLIGLAIVGIVAATWLLAPLLNELPIDWNNVPLVAVFGAFGYAAYPRRGMAFVSHALLSVVLVATIWLKLGSQTYGWIYLFLAALLSGLFMEIWATFLPRIKGDRGDESWRREAIWLMVMAVFGSSIFLEVVTQGYTGIQPVQIITSSILGVIGWFWGDFLRQFLFYRKTGIRRRS
jgi:serine/threonine-protein kinase